MGATEPAEPAIRTGLRVEVCYAEPGRHWRVTLCLPEGSTVDDALQAASADLPERDWATLPLGIHGRLCGRDQRLVEGDRVELYRPLVNDPKAARRARARRR